MPRIDSSGSSHGKAGGGGSGRKRYAAVVEKGENAWRREWSSFMSGVNLKRLRDGTSAASLKASADIDRQLESATTSTAASSVGAAVDVVHVNSDGIPLNAGAGNASFSYLFSSPAERRAEREARERAEKEQRESQKRERMARKDPLSVMSKHQRALHDAAQRGLQLEGMNRKTRREFLRLTVSEAQKKAEEQSREFKLHDLMDPKLAWYQQGPHPVDLIAEKLVRRKAEKNAKQLQLKYNYLAPHPSWLAKRAQRRRESLLVGLGKRLVFQEVEDEVDAAEGEKVGAATTTKITTVVVTDPLRQRTVPLRDMGLLWTPATVALSAASREPATQEGEEEDSDANDSITDNSQANNDRNDNNSVDVSEREKIEKEGDADHINEASATNPVKAVSAASLPDVGVLQDSSRLATSLVRSVVRDRTTAMAIQQINRTTTFLSSNLVKGPSLTAEDTASTRDVPVRMLTCRNPPTRSAGSAASLMPSVNKPKRPTRASAAPSFSPFVTQLVHEEREHAQAAHNSSGSVRTLHEQHKHTRIARDDDVKSTDSEVHETRRKSEKAEMKKPEKLKVTKSVRARTALSHSSSSSAAVAAKGKVKTAKKTSRRATKDAS